MKRLTLGSDPDVGFGHPCVRDRQARLFLVSVALYTIPYSVVTQKEMSPL